MLKHSATIGLGGIAMIALSALGAERVQAQAQPGTTPDRQTALAFRYLYLFRRVVVSLAVVGAIIAWANDFTALMAAFVCVGIGELLESSYYISVLRWRERISRP